MTATLGRAEKQHLEGVDRVRDVDRAVVVAVTPFEAGGERGKTKHADLPVSVKRDEEGSGRRVVGEPLGVGEAGERLQVDIANELPIGGELVELALVVIDGQQVAGGGLKGDPLRLEKGRIDVVGEELPE